MALEDGVAEAEVRRRDMIARQPRRIAVLRHVAKLPAHPVSPETGRHVPYRRLGARFEGVPDLLLDDAPQVTPIAGLVTVTLRRRTRADTE